MLIKKTWAIVAPNNSAELLVSDDLKILKFVQLLMAKTVQLVIKESTGLQSKINTSINPKVNLVYEIVTNESTNIHALRSQKQQEWLQVELLDSVKEFADIVGLSDTFVNESYISERANLLRFEQYCKQHQTLVFQTLHNIDYTQDYDVIKQQLVEAFKKPTADSKNVSSDLSKLLLKNLQ